MCQLDEIWLCICVHACAYSRRARADAFWEIIKQHFNWRIDLIQNHPGVGGLPVDGVRREQSATKTEIWLLLSRSHTIATTPKRSRARRDQSYPVALLIMLCHVICILGKIMTRSGMVMAQTKQSTWET